LKTVEYRNANVRVKIEPDVKAKAYCETPAGRKCQKAKVLYPEELVLLLLSVRQELSMTHPKYLPALRTEARNLGLARLSVRAADDREVGKLLGFVIDPQAQQISSLVLEVADGTGSQQVAVPMVPLCLDAESHALRLIHTGTLPAIAFRPDSVSQLDEDDFWVPLIHTAA
jgi:hypothetical protein